MNLQQLLDLTGARAAKDNKKIDLDKITPYLAAKDEDTILDAVTNKSALFDKAYKTIFNNALAPEMVLLTWLVGLLAEKKRIEKLEEIGDDIDAVTKVVLGVYGTSWGIYAVFMLIKKMENNLTKFTMEKMNDKKSEIETALKKYICNPPTKKHQLKVEISRKLLQGEFL